MYPIWFQKRPLFTVLSALTIFLLFFSVSAFAQDNSQIDTTIAVDTTLAEIRIVPPSSVEVSDVGNDAGGSIDIHWQLSPEDQNGGPVISYSVLRAESVDGTLGDFTEIGSVPAGASTYADGNTVDGLKYVYKVAATAASGAVFESGDSIPVSSSAQWFDMRRINVFVGVLLVAGFIVYYIRQAKAGKELFIRKIAGLDAVDEAVGRATEMGKKIFYVPGTQDMDNVQTIAGVTILGRVAEMAAQYETWLEVPVSRSLVLVTAKEMVKEAYSKAGRPDAYHEDQVHYLTDDQFGYAAGVDGMVVREKPATIFYMGAFYAESLILAETGNSIGAIQIAGTGMPSQLPFFVAACDYTLIGEELFAASAYLSREPKQLGSLKGQDMGKAVILIALIVGLLLETFGIWNFSTLFSVIE
ncbi:MAG: fibronectin type III domain-containing protein [bacterium]|nr:fibronectin type III domain-containing protein [bacterium]